ncbi:MAG: SusC/RagA family TonB-linked outer membrane protein [Candidatus Pseudobacter hemicellulosilyticus]|uniref:SusC/RagA family TonB-linked outer membrane protein n=1 Tax=Candidatus Pseudobacter hemicellulosilyticus TaxID=3121375 RepID=A0AAJ6BFD5_9BACT|nr:MAG: SusC/RagA family TonB-linked outer membrane protein [Pseudobacter sp.]
MKKVRLMAAGLLVLVLNLPATLTAQEESEERSLPDTTSVPGNNEAYEPGPLLRVPRSRSVASYSTVSGQDLFRTPVANISNTLYGLLPGLRVTQRSGEPGYDDAVLQFRGGGTYDNSGLIIYVDGFQVQRSYFAYLSPLEIESITILKDPVTLATFGMKGANGVLWVETKRGQAKKPTINVQVVNGWQQALDYVKPYGSYNYARKYNEAVSNDNYSLNGYQFDWTPTYTEAQLQAYRDGTGTNVDWYGEALRKNSPYTNANVNLKGGDSNTRYAVILDYMRQGGMYDVATNSTNSNAQIQRYNIRSNLDFRFFKIFEAKVDLGGRIEDRRYPNFNGPSLWSNMASYPANIYPVVDASGHWSGTTTYPNNPLASLRALGWASTHDRTLQANFNLKQRLDFITPGLYLSEAASFNTWNRTSASKTATYARFNNGVQTTTDKQTDIISNGARTTNQYDWKQYIFTAGYDRSFGVHQLSGAVNYFISDYVVDYGTNQAGLNTGDNIFYHFKNIGGRFNYTYDRRYIAEIGFGFSGSDNYAPGNRWGFYPALSLGWVLSNEAFLEENTTVTNLKLRVSGGLTGNDQSANGRYLYKQYYGGSGTYYTGASSLTSNAGIRQQALANPDIFAEQSLKLNAGVDATFFNKLSLSLEVFQDKRTDIVGQDNSLSATFGALLPYVNLGKVTTKGLEATLRFQERSGPVDWWAGAMISYAKNKIDYRAEVPTLNDFSRVTGSPIGTPIGLIADGFYDIDDFDADGTLKDGIPTPAFGAVQPGDIKYKDLDGNNRVDQNDVTRIGDPEYPNLIYAIDAGARFKGFDLSVLFQGAAGTDVNLLTAAAYQTVAFVQNSNITPIAGNAWAYYPDQGIDTRASANYPRLTTKANENNYRTSSFWMKKGNFLRIRQIEAGYNIPAATLRRMGLNQLRVYVSAINPFTWSYLGREYGLDPETWSGYPGLKSYNVGINLTF